MLDAPEALRLIIGITQFTHQGKIKWMQKDSPPQQPSAGVLKYAVRNPLNQPATFVAKTDGALFEISSSDNFGGAPYEFRAWELGEQNTPVASLRSSTSVYLPEDLRMNKALEVLFRVANASTESGEEIVNRLLGKISRS